MIDIEDLVENCWQREIRFLSRCFRKLFSAFTFSLDKNNIGCPFSLLCFPYTCQQKNASTAKKYFGFVWTNRKKAGPERIRNAKKTHSSLLRGKIS
jgi:hypothetical protein